MKIGDRVFVHGYIDEIRKDTVIIRNNGGYFGTIPSEVITGELPSAQPERKKGKWHRRFYPQIEMMVCSECQEEFSYDAETGIRDYNYCPNCGADMRTAEQIVHDAIDNTPMAEDAYPGIKERLHKAVDDMREVTNGN